MFFRRRRAERDLDDEIRFDLAEESRRLLESGESPGSAWDSARRSFGSVSRIKEETREAWGWAGTEPFVQDVRFAIRTLRTSPGFSIAAVLTLAVGLGLCSFLFILGRFFDPDLERRGAPPSAVVSEHFWRSRLDADAHAIGREIWINRQRTTIIGVAEKDFQGLFPITPGDIFVPATADVAVAPELAANALENPASRLFRLVMRLAPGVDIKAAEAALDTRVVVFFGAMTAPAPPARASGAGRGRVVRQLPAAARLRAPARGQRCLRR